MAHFGDMLAAVWMRLWVPRGRFMVTKTETPKFGVVKDYGNVKFRVTDHKEVVFRERRHHGV